MNKIIININILPAKITPGYQYSYTYTIPEQRFYPRRWTPERPLQDQYIRVKYNQPVYT